MSDTFIWTVTPLTDTEKRERFDVATTITIEGDYSKHAIGVDWKSQNDGHASPMGYAQRRTTERIHDNKLSMTIPLLLDVPQLTAAILAEIERQRKGAMPGQVMEFKP